MARRYYFHAAPTARRSAIQRVGLRPGHKASYGPPGVYMFRNRSFAEDYRFNVPADVWRVDTAGMTLSPDPEDPNAAVYVEHSIPVDRLMFLGTYLNGEEIN